MECFITPRSVRPCHQVFFYFTVRCLLLRSAKSDHQLVVAGCLFSFQSPARGALAQCRSPSKVLVIHSAEASNGSNWQAGRRASERAREWPSHARSQGGDGGNGDRKWGSGTAGSKGWLTSNPNQAIWNFSEPPEARASPSRAGNKVRLTVSFRHRTWRREKSMARRWAKGGGAVRGWL